MRILLWALPTALSLHVVEEFAVPGGFSRWIVLHNPQQVKSTTYYVVVNAAAILGSVAIALFARGPVGYWLYLYSVALMAGNSLSHLSASFRHGQYCPGSISAAVLLIPLLVAGSWLLIADGAVAIPWATLAIALGLTVGLYLFAVDVRPFALQSRNGTT